MERLHLTIAVLPLLPAPDASVAAALARALGGVEAAACEVVLARFVSRAHATAALRPTGEQPALEALHAAVMEALHRQGLPTLPGYRFAPHVTLAYRATADADHPIAPIGWMADRLRLVASHQGVGRHELLGEWPLAAAPPRSRRRGVTGAGERC